MWAFLEGRDCDLVSLADCPLLMESVGTAVAVAAAVAVLAFLTAAGGVSSATAAVTGSLFL
jgi:hypothetical protein